MALQGVETGNMKPRLAAMVAAIAGWSGSTPCACAMAITTGTTVDFPNNDRVYHNVFSLSKARTFDLGRYAVGRSRAVRFVRPGIVRVFCDIHSHMSAWVLVFNHPYFAVTDGEGRYVMRNVPPGTYSLAVWHETLPLERRRIEVPAGGGTVQADFTMGAR